MPYGKTGPEYSQLPNGESTNSLATTADIRDLLIRSTSRLDF